MLPEEDRATATGDLHTKFREDQSSSSRDMLMDRQTHRQLDRQTHTHRQNDTQTDGLITILCTLPGRSKNFLKLGTTTIYIQTSDKMNISKQRDRCGHNCIKRPVSNVMKLGFSNVTEKL